LIRLTRLDGKQFILNADLIEVIDETPDTVITTTTGRRFIVSEKGDEVVKRCIDYRRDCAVTRVTRHYHQEDK